MDIALLLLHGAVSDNDIFSSLDSCLAEQLITVAEAVALALPLGIAYEPPSA